MIPTIYDICEKNVKTVNILNTLDDAIKSIASSEKRTVVIIDDRNEDIKYSILTTINLIDFKINATNHQITLDKLPLTYHKSLPHDLSILSVLNHIDLNDQYMIICKHEKLVGIISYTDVINHIDPKLIIERQTLGSVILDYKAIFVYEDSSTLQAISLIKENNTDSIIVKNASHEAIGIFTTKDFINLMYDDVDLATPIKNHMSTPISSLNINSPISDALAFIKEKQFKRIVVMNDKKRVEGVITQKELLRISYNKWIELIKKEHDFVSEVNEKLLKTKTQLENEISLDYLTKISNRFSFNKKIKHKINLIRKDEEKIFSILIIDIDNFAQINETFGNLEGDATLQEIAEILGYIQKDNDLLARWSGEKFILALHNTDIENSLLLAETIRTTIEKYIFKIKKTITCSIGISSYHENDTKDTLFTRAETALKRAKLEGKNRVELEVF